MGKYFSSSKNSNFLPKSQMIQKAKSIALHTVRYGESSLIAYLYTEEFGRISVMVNGAYGKGKSAKKAIYFQPLNIIDVVYYPAKNHGLGRLKEVSVSTANTSLHLKPVKSAIGLFLGEIIYRAIREEESNTRLFRYLELSIQTLDIMEQGTANFHLIFLAHLTRYLGFYPNGNYSEHTPYFDYKSGLFIGSEPAHPFFFAREHSQTLSAALGISYSNALQIHLNGKQRNEFLSHMLRFYTYHMETMQSLKSLEILTQVFED